MATVRVPPHLRSQISEAALVSHPASFAPRHDPLEKHAWFKWQGRHFFGPTNNEIHFAPPHYMDLTAQKRGLANAKSMAALPRPSTSQHARMQRQQALRGSSTASLLGSRPTTANVAPSLTQYPLRPPTPCRPIEGLRHLDCFMGSHGADPDTWRNKAYERPTTTPLRASRSKPELKPPSLEVVRLLQPSVEPDGMPNWWHRSEPAMSEAKIREVFPFA